LISFFGFLCLFFCFVVLVLLLWVANTKLFTDQGQK
jgi:hypothetical protein